MRLRFIIPVALWMMFFNIFSPSLAQCELVNLLSLQEGCLPINIPQTLSGWDEYNILDESPSSGWASEKGKVGKHILTFELASEAILERLEFDTAAIDMPGSAIKDIIVEVSRKSPKRGYVRILKASLKEGVSGQKFEVAKKVPAQWVRLIVLNNHGNAERMELFGFKGFGERPESKAISSVSGTYATNRGNLHVLQQDMSLSGCYEHKSGLLNGVIDGRIMKITWRESGGEDHIGPAVLVLSKDGKSFRGLWWYNRSENDAPNGVWSGSRIAKTIGNCPHWGGLRNGGQKDSADTVKQSR